MAKDKKKSTSSAGVAKSKSKSKSNKWKPSEKYIYYIAGVLALVFVFALALVLCFRSGVESRQRLKAQIVALEKQQDSLSQQIVKLDKVQPIYVYNLEKVVTALDLVLSQTDFKNQVLKLSKEVDDAKKKISNMKKSKVREDFSEVYLKSLTLKRDELIEKHEKEMIEVTKNINKALAEVAEEKNAPAVFNMSAVAVTTGHVIDLSDEVVDRVNEILKNRDK